MQSNFKCVSIFGQGFVGLPLAVLCLRSGYKVTGVDIDSGVISRIKNGENLPPEVNPNEIKSFLENGQYEVTSNPELIGDSEVIIVCVPTPLGKNHEPDLAPLKSAVRVINEFAKSARLIINESTSYPGTLRELFESVINGDRTQRREEVLLAVAPERINPGDSTPLNRIPRVIGGINEESLIEAKKFYESLGLEVKDVSTPEIAEMSKLLENTFRQVNISLVNEIQDLCIRTGIDLREAIEAASTKPYGYMAFAPSAGIGGHCIPVDPEYLQFFSRRKFQELSLVREASKINSEMATRILRRIENTGFVIQRDMNALIVGVTYKPNIRDTRETPAEPLLEALLTEGIRASWHDPVISIWNGTQSSALNASVWDFSVIVTPQENLDLETLIANSRVVFDSSGMFRENNSIIQI